MTKHRFPVARQQGRNALLSVLLVFMMFLGILSMFTSRVEAASLPVVKSNQGLTVKRVSPGVWATFRDSDGARVSYTGVCRNEYGWWRTVDGVVDFDCNSIEKNDHGWWRIENGKVNFSANGVYENKYGWWSVKNGKVDFSFTGFDDNEYGKWRIENGKVNFRFGGLISGGGGHWYFVTKGKVDTSYEGIVINNYGAWYVKDGEAQFDFNGTFKGYTFEGGKVITE